MVSRSAAAERILQLENKAQELREQMERVCSQYGLLTQELFIIVEAIKIELKQEIDTLGNDRNNFPKLGGYLVD